MIVGITGGIGSGKSAVLDILKEEYGAHIIKADDVAKDVMVNDSECVSKIKEAFADESYNEDGSLNKAYISGVIYKDESKRELINSIVHPIVQRRIIDEICNVRNKLICIEAALLIESGYTSMCDEVWYVYCEINERKRRVLSSRNMTEEKFNSIVKSQLSEEEFKINTDKLINNSFDKDFTRKEVQRVLVWG
ncbi:dephospho-CoA kinase [Eubacterium uniforme]|uniref:Dephospho-CoA kinase n=1 Tax=Eubacterium uniforme TaxID=39495 RepID=A0A1T4W5J3_9FIRM|nr:dephospho-CoA kinase [Eubacterium uniforme]SKA72513.1 dephospho-CoA kinase [Eubacterium uniforme]HAH17418.1 dephospho-CoA kinase [Eubacterium sp.]